MHPFSFASGIRRCPSCFHLHSSRLNHPSRRSFLTCCRWTNHPIRSFHLKIRSIRPIHSCHPMNRSGSDCVIRCCPDFPRDFPGSHRHIRCRHHCRSESCCQCSLHRNFRCPGCRASHCPAASRCPSVSRRSPSFPSHSCRPIDSSRPVMTLIRSGCPCSGRSP
jgi:hypothetical protein